MTAEIRRYIKEKVKVLDDFRLTDQRAVYSHLLNHLKPELSDEFNMIRIDNEAKNMINDYFNGDRSFCKKLADMEVEYTGDDD